MRTNLRKKRMETNWRLRWIKYPETIHPIPNQKNIHMIKRTELNSKIIIEIKQYPIFAGIKITLIDTSSKIYLV